MSALSDAEFLALLVHRGHVSIEDAHALQRDMRAGRGLDEILAERPGFGSERVERLRRTRAGEIPEIPGFEMLGLLGTGGTSDVLRASEKKTGRIFALKVLNLQCTQNPTVLNAFVHEARLLQKLDHPGLVKGHGVLGFLEDGKKRYFSRLELVQGSTLLELLDRGERFPEDLLLAIVESVAGTLAYLAIQGVVHRDIKPGNLMIGGDGRVKLIDLGFAATNAQKSKEGVAAGTKEYLAPEQAVGGGVADLRSDVYSLGATLFHLAIGRLPFEATDDRELLRQHVMASLSSPEMKSRGISPHLHYLIERMMSKDPEHRFQSWEVLVNEVRETRATIAKMKSLDAEPEAPERRSSPRRRKF